MYIVTNTLDFKNVVLYIYAKIHRGYFMESATYGILFTSCLYHRTNERVPERIYIPRIYILVYILLIIFSAGRHNYLIFFDSFFNQLLYFWKLFRTLNICLVIRRPSSWVRTLDWDKLNFQ
jgi:hypothetical protein